MITSSDRRAPRVRAGFLKWSTAVFVLLLPFAAHAIWDYVETRRLVTRIDAIVGRGEPITISSQRALPQPRGGPADAARFYRAASALASGYFLAQSSQQASQLNAAMRTGDVPPELLDVIRARVEEYGEALSLADRAAALPFEGFGPGYTFLYLSDGLMAVSRLCEMRAIERVVAGDAMRRSRRSTPASDSSVPPLAVRRSCSSP